MQTFSVLLSLYEKEKVLYFDRAMKSIWEEQTLKPNQIVLVKDGILPSELENKVSDWQEKLGEVLTIVSLPVNKGLAKALNEGLTYCANELVARMDTDDVALPERFYEQVRFMEQHIDISVCSSYIEEWDENLENRLQIKTLPLEHNELLLFAKKRCPLAHPAVMYRKSVILSVNGYPEFRKAQDYALWALLLTNNYKIANIPMVLLKMRTGQELFARRSWLYFRRELEVFAFQKHIGFLSRFELVRNVGIRFFIRLAPTAIQKIIYSKFR